MNFIKEGSIAPAIRAMEVGDTLAYPMERYSCVQNTLVRLRNEDRTKLFRTTTKRGELEVMREQ